MKSIEVNKYLVTYITTSGEARTVTIIDFSEQDAFETIDDKDDCFRVLSVKKDNTKLPFELHGDMANQFNESQGMGYSEDEYDGSFGQPEW